MAIKWDDENYILQKIAPCQSQIELGYEQAEQTYIQDTNPFDNYAQFDNTECPF